MNNLCAKCEGKKWYDEIIDGRYVRFDCFCLKPPVEDWEARPAPTNIAEHFFDRVKTEFEKHAKYMDAKTFAACVTAKMRTCIDDHIRAERERVMAGCTCRKGEVK